MMVGIVGACDNGDDDCNCDGGGVDSFGNDYAGEITTERSIFSNDRHTTGLAYFFKPST